MASSLRWGDLNLVRPLGEGHAGQVWLATVKRATDTLRQGEEVAVKQYKRWVLQEPGQHERVNRELAASVRVRHPNIVQGVALVSDPEGLPALVMRYHEGRSLEALLAEGRSSGPPLSAAHAFRMLGPLLEAVAALHSEGILHRDIKPANILIETGSGSPRLMDLGVVSDFLLPEQTQTATFLGTVRYADPGYLTGGRFTAASDWYSLGLVAYEMFFAERFLHSEEQWARLVARKLALRLPSGTELAEGCRALGRREGQDAAEAVFFTLTTVLINPTEKALFRLRNAISAEFWERPFFERADGEIVPGEPAGIQEFRASLEGELDRLSRPTRDEALSRLRTHLDEHYWGLRASRHPGLSEPAGPPIDRIPFYAGGSGDDTTYDFFIIDETVTALYRYGHLDAEQDHADDQPR